MAYRADLKNKQAEITAAIVDKMVLAVDDAGDLFVVPEKDLTDVTLIANTGTQLVDMAYNHADDNIYAVNRNDELVTVDRMTCCA